MATAGQTRLNSKGWDVNNKLPTIFSAPIGMPVLILAASPPLGLPRSSAMFRRTLIAIATSSDTPKKNSPHSKGITNAWKRKTQRCELGCRPSTLPVSNPTANRPRDSTQRRPRGPPRGHPPDLLFCERVKTLLSHACEIGRRRFIGDSHESQGEKTRKEKKIPPLHDPVIVHSSAEWIKADSSNSLRLRNRDDSRS